MTNNTLGHLGSNMTNNTLAHLGSNPVSKNVLQGVVACLSRFSDNDKIMYHGIIERMGGSFKLELGADHLITHLIISPEEVDASANMLFCREKSIMNMFVGGAPKLSYFPQNIPSNRHTDKRLGGYP
jgi:hypothetical protein